MLYRFRKKDEEKDFSAVYKRYQKPILKYVSQKVRDPEVAQDLVQEVFLKVYKSLESYDRKYAFSTWLWTIARNTVLDWHRKHALQNSSSIEEEELASLDPSAETLLERKSHRKMLRACFRKLTGLQRKVIWLRVIHQFSYDEIAKRLGLSLSAVKCLAYRSKLALKQMGYSPAFA